MFLGYFRLQFFYVINCFYFVRLGLLAEPGELERKADRTEKLLQKYFISPHTINAPANQTFLVNKKMSKKTCTVLVFARLVSLLFGFCLMLAL